MPKSYPNSVRRQISHRLRSGDTVADIATETGISAATLFRWKGQALIDAGGARRCTEYRVRRTRIGPRPHRCTRS